MDGGGSRDGGVGKLGGGEGRPPVAPARGPRPYGPYAETLPSTVLPIAAVREAFDATVERIASTGYVLTMEERDAVHEVGVESRRLGAKGGLVGSAITFGWLTSMRGRVYASSVWVSLLAAVVIGRKSTDSGYAFGINNLAVLPRSSALGGEIRAAIAEAELARVAEQILTIRRMRGEKTEDPPAPINSYARAPSMKAAIARYRQVFDSDAPRLLSPTESKESVKARMGSLGLAWILHELERPERSPERRPTSPGDVGPLGIAEVLTQAADASERPFIGVGNTHASGTVPAEGDDAAQYFLIGPISTYGDPGGVPPEPSGRIRVGHAERRRLERAWRAERIEKARNAFIGGVPVDRAMEIGKRRGSRVHTGSQESEIL